MEDSEDLLVQHFDKYVTQNSLKKYREENTPVVCPVFQHPTEDTVVDHCHKTGCIRQVISREANSFLGKVENDFRRRGGVANCDLPSALMNLAKYLRRERSGILHPTGATQLTKRFKRLPLEKQVKILHRFGYSQDEIQAAKNAENRGKMYRDVITGKKEGAK